MSVIDDYLARLPAPHRAALERIRQIVKRDIPDVEEVISYGMPAFKYKHHYLIGFNAFRDHLSLFPTGAPVEVLKGKLTDYKISKGTIQFTLDKPLPEELIIELVRVRQEAINKHR